MTPTTPICWSTGADLEDSIAALCLIASVAHAVGDGARRDDAVDLAAEMAAGLAPEIRSEA